MCWNGPPRTNEKRKKNTVRNKYPLDWDIELLAFDHPPVLAIVLPYKEVAVCSGSCLPSPCLGFWLVLYAHTTLTGSGWLWLSRLQSGTITVASLTFFSYSLSLSSYIHSISLFIKKILTVYIYIIYLRLFLVVLPRSVSKGPDVVFANRPTERVYKERQRTSYSTLL